MLKDYGNDKINEAVEGICYGLEALVEAANMCAPKSQLQGEVNSIIQYIDDLGNSLPTDNLRKVLDHYAEDANSAYGKRAVAEFVNFVVSCTEAETLTASYESQPSIYTLLICDMQFDVHKNSLMYITSYSEQGTGYLNADAIRALYECEDCANTLEMYIPIEDRAVAYNTLLRECDSLIANETTNCHIYLLCKKVVNAVRNNVSELSVNNLNPKLKKLLREFSRLIYLYVDYLYITSFEDVANYCDAFNISLDTFSETILIPDRENTCWMEVAAHCPSFDAATQVIFLT